MDYLEYLWGRPEPSVAQTVIWDATPHVLMECVYTTIFFSCLSYFSPRLIAYLWPKFYSSLDIEKRSALCSWTSGFVHHIIVAPLGFYMIYKDYYTSADIYTNTIDYAKTYGELGFLKILPYCFGYIVADTIFFAYPELFRHKYEYFIHHIASIFLFYSFVGSSGATVRYMSHFLICETTGIFLTIAWFIRNVGYRESWILSFMENSFTISFFFTRILNLPLALYSLLLLPSAKTLGMLKFILVPIIILQFYWFYLIFKATLKKKGLEEGKTGKNEKKGGDEDEDDEIAATPVRKSNRTLTKNLKK